MTVNEFVALKRSQGNEVIVEGTSNPDVVKLWINGSKHYSDDFSLCDVANAIVDVPFIDF